MTLGFGMAMALLATLGWGIAAVMARRAMFHAPTGAVLIVATTLVAVVLVTINLLVHGPGAFSGLPPRFFGLVLIMAVLAYVTGELFCLLGMRRAGLVITAPIVGTVPLFAVTFAIALGGERPDPPTIVGAIVIVTGVFIILTDRDRVLR